MPSNIVSTSDKVSSRETDNKSDIKRASYLHYFKLMLMIRLFVQRLANPSMFPTKWTKPSKLPRLKSRNRRKIGQSRVSLQPPHLPTGSRLTSKNYKCSKVGVLTKIICQMTDLLLTICCRCWLFEVVNSILGQAEGVPQDCWLFRS